jgi:hypothetical protein
MEVLSQRLEGNPKKIPKDAMRALLAILDYLEGRRHDDPAFRDELSAHVVGDEMTGGPDFWMWIAKRILVPYNIKPDATKFMGRGCDWNVANQKALRECLGLPLSGTGVVRKVFDCFRRIMAKVMQTP